MSTRTLKTTLRKLRAVFGDRGFQQAGRDFLRTGNEPPEKWKDRCDDLAKTIATMKSLDLDYDKPGPEEDFEAVLALKREEWPRVLTPRWYPLFIHVIQHALWCCLARFVVVPAGRRSGKCLAAGQLVAMSDGRWIHVEDVRTGDAVLSMTDGYRIESRIVSDVMTNGVKPTVIVKTTQREIRCTPNHPFLVNNEWTEAGDIKPKDLIGVPRKIPEPIDSVPMDPEIVDFLAIWLAEGSGCTLSNGTPAIVSIIHRLAVRFRCTLKQWAEVDWYFHCGTRSHPMRRELEKFGLWGKTSKTKFIPDDVFRLPKGQLARFLNVFFACDGSIYPRSSSGQYTVCMGLANETMLRQIASLLHRFEIRGSIRKKVHAARSSRTGEHFLSWDFSFSESEAVRIFCEEIGCIGKEDRVIAALNGTRKSRGTCNEYLPVSVSDAMSSLCYEPVLRTHHGLNAIIRDAPTELLCVLKNWKKQDRSRISTYRYRQLEPWTDGRFKNIAKSGVVWEEVLSVEEDEDTETYNLTVEGNHNFIANGFVTHNTERAMRYFVMRALSFFAHPDGRFFACAPTHDHARDLFWDELKALIPARFVTRISEGRLTIYLWNGAQIRVRGLDVPSRVEGKPVDGMIIDEFGDMRQGDKLWEKHLEAVLTEVGREGWAWIFGVPRGRPHYKKFYESAKLDTPDWEDFEGFTWKSKDILSPAKLERIQRRTDPMTFASEWEASFETTGTRIYYQFNRDAHLVHLEYDPRLPLDVSADFNISPGVLIISQEQPYTGPRADVAHVVTAVIGEVWIQTMSNTPRVMEKFNKDWGQHKGRVRFFGDATGGTKKTTSVRGSDWDIIREMARAQFPDRCTFRVPRGNPPEVSRTNAVNAHLMATDGTVSTLIDPDKAPHLVTDFEDVCPKEGTREIEKVQGSLLTHTSDAFGYRIYADFPIDGAQYGEDALW